MQRVWDKLPHHPEGFNKELLILEKKRDGKPFELHTDLSDKLNTYKTVRHAYAWAVLMLLSLIAVTFIPGVSSASVLVMWALRIVAAILALLFIIPTMKYSSLVGQLKEEGKTFE